MPKLTNKQARFVVEYQKDQNATQAAIRAGFSVKNADNIASRLISKSQVAEAIEKAMKSRLQKIGVHAERVLTELAKVAFSDVTKVYKVGGILKLPEEWPEEIKGAIAGVETFEEFSGRGEDRKLIGYTKKIKTYDKVRALENLMKHLGLFPTEKKDDDGGVKEINITNLELSAKIILLVTIAMQKQKQKELEEEQESQPLLNKL